MNIRVNIKKKLLFAAIVTISVFVFVEFVARLVEFITPPSKTERTQIIPPKQEGNYRIFAYGGSTVAGQPVEQFGFLSQLEFWLRETHPEKALEVYNFGKGGRASGYVRQMVQETITQNPDLLIVLSGHNEFLTRRIEGRLDKIRAGFALTRLLDRARRQAFLLRKQVFMPNRIEGYDRDSTLFREKVQIYRDNLREIAQIARQNKKPLILLTAPSNVSDWPPVYKKIAMKGYGYEEKYEAWFAEIDGFLADGHIEGARERIEELFQMHRKDNPLLLYLLARVARAAGDYERARMLFAKAKDLDPIPWRELTEFNQAIKQLAELDGVFVVDVEKSFQQHAMHGLVGFSLVADNAHPTPLGNAIIAKQILAVMRRKRLFVEKDLDPSSINRRLEEFLSRTTTPEKRRSLEMEYLLRNAKYAMKTPFYNFKASRMYLEKALAMDASNWEIWVNFATIGFFENRIEEGRQQLRKAIQLRGEPIDQYDRKSAPYLAEALEQSGIRLEELQ